MKDVNADRSTRMSLPSATSTWRSAAKQGRGVVKIAVGHLEKEQRLESALDEYCQLREQDRSLTASRFCDRYPSYRHSLRRLIDVHEAMESQPALEYENWPELFSDFLGYEILHELGVGAIARVYLATEAALGGRLVAIKVAQEGGDEAETLGRLSHPNIVPVFSVKHDEKTDLTAVCMPYHGSATLADLLEVGFQNGTPPTTARTILDAAREREQLADFVEVAAGPSSINSDLLRGSYVDGIVRLGIQMAEALAYTHERGILHRDLKPSNVLLTPEGVPMLLDFNLASDIETGAQRLGGTLPYMPPEQIRDVHLQPFVADVTGDPRSDIFSLAVILYELLTGKLPFGDPPACVTPRQAAEALLAAQLQVPRPVRDLNPAVTPKLEQLIHKCLALQPGQRPASAADLVSELKKYFSPRQRAQRWTSRHRGLVATIVLLFVLTSTAAIWHLATRPPYAVREYNYAVSLMDVDIESERHSDALNASIKHLNEAIDRHPDCGEFRFARGVAHQRLGKHQLADSDFQEAAKTMKNALFVECSAYSKLHALALPERVRAQAMYGKLAVMRGPLPPELELNWAYTFFHEGESAPWGAIGRATKAIKAKPEWQKAYHLRALAFYRLANSGSHIGEMQLRALGLDRPANSGTRINPIDLSIQDFEQALLLEPVGQRLCLDTAKAYAMREQDAPTERLIESLRKAVALGLPKNSLVSLGTLYSWQDAEWYMTLLKNCVPTVETEQLVDEDYFLSPPDYDAVQRFLLEAQPVLPKD